MTQPFPILLLDGGLGTTLEDAHAQKFNDQTPLWSSHLLITSPSTLLSAQKSFADAGADVILTATYQASTNGFALTKDPASGDDTGTAAGLSGYGVEEAEKYMRSAIPIARQAFEAKNKNGKVALSLGAYGATMYPVSQEYTGLYDSDHNTIESLRKFHADRIKIFQCDPETWYNIDMIAFETLPNLQEIHAVREAIYTSLNGWDRKFWISCVFPGEENDMKLPDGSGIEEVVGAMIGGAMGKALPFGIGINCTRIAKLRGLIGEFEKAIQKLMGQGEVDAWPFLVLYPDGAEGLVYNTETHTWDAKTGKIENQVPWDQALIEIVKDVKAKQLWRGIIVGGCCKTLPKNIANLRARIDEL